MSLIFFEITKACSIENYLLNCCETLFQRYNYKEKSSKYMPERMTFETPIWGIGEQIRQEFIKDKKLKTNELLISKILAVVQIAKYRKGRESFVMLLHNFKNNSSIESVLASLLIDEDLYAFAIGELNKLKLYNYTDKVKYLLAKEKIAWRRKTEERYITNSLKYNVAQEF